MLFRSPPDTLCQSNVYYTRNFCPISTPVSCQEPYWEYGNLKPKFKQQFLSTDSRAYESPKCGTKSAILSHLSFPAPSPRNQLHIPCWKNYMDTFSADKMRDRQTRSAAFARKDNLVHPVIQRITTAYQPESMNVPRGKHNPSGFEKQINYCCIGK